MINTNPIVEENTVLVIPDLLEGEDERRLLEVFRVPSEKRAWFSPHFYKDNKLSRGNTLGFIVSAEYDFTLSWDGTEGPDSIILDFHNTKEHMQSLFPMLSSDLGKGILSVKFPMKLQTSPGVQLMTVQPPNYVIPNLVVLTQVLETGIEEQELVIHIKVPLPHVKVKVEAGAPLAGIIPVIANFADGFRAII